MRKPACLALGLAALLGAGRVEAAAGPGWLDVSASVSEMYDSNVTFAESDEQDDLITRLALGLAARQEVRNATIKLEGRLRQQLYADNSDFNNLAGDLNLDIHGELSKLDRFSFRNAFTHSRDPEQFEEEHGRVSGRYGYLRNRARLEYERSLSPQWTIGAAYANEIDELSRSDLRDSITNQADFNAEYAMDSQNIWLGTTSFIHREYDPGGGVFTFRVLPGYRYFFTDQLSLEGRAGIDVLNEALTDETRVKPRLSLVLNHELAEQTVASAVLERVYETTAYDLDIFKVWRFSAGVQRELLRRLNGSAHAYIGQGEYLTSGVEDQLAGAGLGLTYAVTKHLEADLGYRFSDVDSSDSTREYQKHTVLIGLRWRF
jgi:hypothetical protein